MKVGVIIPDRGDRPEFTANCLRMLSNQTLQPHCIELVNFPPYSDECDITLRYRTGYDRLRDKGLDLIAFIENDDWYAPHYLETMAGAWKWDRCPDIFGTQYTYLYHLRHMRYYKVLHRSMSLAMGTVIKPDLDFKWCKDSEPLTDAWLWSKLRGVTFGPDIINIGIKHGIGKVGSVSHRDRMDRYINEDKNFDWLRSHVDSESLRLYIKIHEDLVK